MVIGKRAADVEKAAAMDYVAGYTIVNDVSERDFQFTGGGGQGIKGKSRGHLRPDGPLAGHQGRVPAPAKPQHVAR